MPQLKDHFNIITFIQVSNASPAASAADQAQHLHTTIFFWLADPQQLAAIACIIFDDGHWMIAGGMEESKAATHCCMLTGEPWSREKGTDFLAHSLPHMQLEGREQLTLWLRGSCLRRHTPLTFVKH